MSKQSFARGKKSKIAPWGVGGLKEGRSKGFEVAWGGARFGGRTLVLRARTGGRFGRKKEGKARCVEFRMGRLVCDLLAKAGMASRCGIRFGFPRAH